MRKVLPLLAAGLLLTGTVLQAQEPETQEGVSLAIYNRGTALVQDVRQFDLDAGLNTLDFTDVSANIDATSVIFNAQTNPSTVRVLEQNFVFDLVGTSALLERYLDETISITVEDGTTFTGQLLSGRNNDIILRDEDGQVMVVSLNKVRDIQFPNLPDGLITRPTLRWLLEAENAGTEQVELTYLTGGLNWYASYNILLNNENDAVDLNGWVTLTNTSGATYQNATVKLVAGDVNRVNQVTREAEIAPVAMAAAADGVSDVSQRELFEYQLYEVNRPVTVADNETKQVEFVTGAGIPAQTFYVYEGYPGFSGYYGPVTDRSYGSNYGVTNVQNWIEFTTHEDGGLGADLPAGSIRVYQEDIDGVALLIGENSIDHTPQGEDVSLYLGNAFDLVGERTQTDFRLVGRDVIEETYEIRLRNRKDSETVEIRVPETLFRWSNWEILNASDEYTKTDSSHIEFRVPVEPGEEKVITYTVRYSW